MPDTSGVMSFLPFCEVSTTPRTASEPRVPALSSGRGVRMLIVEPMPPDGTVARPDL